LSELLAVLRGNLPQIKPFVASMSHHERPFTREFWLQRDGQPEQVLRSGESFTLPDRAVHNEGSTDRPAKLNVVYVVEKGKPLASRSAIARLWRARECFTQRPIALRRCGISGIPTIGADSRLAPVAY